MNIRQQCLVWSIAKVAAVALPLAIMSASAQAAAPQSKPSLISKPLKGGPRADWTGTWVLADSFLDRQDGTALAFRNGREENDSQYKDMFLAPPKLKPEVAKRLAAAPMAPPRQCTPLSMPLFWSGLYAFEIIQSRTQINVFQELGDRTRRIYLDGRPHPGLDDVEPLGLGHSIGHWEGDDLVVDTTNFNTNMLLAVGVNHTEKTRIVERFRPVGDDRIDVDVTTTDPDLLAEPWKFVRHLRRKPNTDIMDYDCQENNRNPMDAEGREHAIIQSPQK